MKLENVKRGHYDAGLNLLPVINIAMVVLIVFMIGVSFVGPEHFLPSNVPISQEGSAGDPPPGWVPDEPLEIRVDADPRAPGRFIATAGRIQVSSGSQLAAQLSEMREQLNAAGIGTDRIQVQISPGRNVRYGALIEVYEAAMLAEFEKIGFTTGR